MGETEIEFKAFARKVRRLLKEIEWNGSACELDYDWEENPIEEYYPACPACGEQWEHRDDCKLFALIKESNEIIRN